MAEHDDVETDLDRLEELVDHAKIEMVKPTVQSRAKARNSLRKFFLVACEESSLTDFQAI